MIPNQPRWKPGDRPDLIGRDLVPFFTEKEEINESLDSKPTNSKEISIEVRTWNPEGYFENPQEIKSAATKNQSSLDIVQDMTFSNTVDPGAELLKMLLKKPKPDSSRSTPSIPKHKIESISPKKYRGNKNKNKTKTTIGSTRSTSKSKNPSSMSADESILNSSTLLLSGLIQSNEPKQSKLKDSKHKNKKKAITSNYNNSDKNPPFHSPSKQKSTSKKKKGHNNDSQSKTKIPSASFAWSSFQNSPDPKSIPMPSFSVKPSKTDESHENDDIISSVPMEKVVYNLETNVNKRVALNEAKMTSELKKMLNIG